MFIFACKICNIVSFDLNGVTCASISISAVTVSPAFLMSDSRSVICCDA